MMSSPGTEFATGSANADVRRRDREDDRLPAPAGGWVRRPPFHVQDASAAAASAVRRHAPLAAGHADDRQDQDDESHGHGVLQGGDLLGLLVGGVPAGGALGVGD